MKGLISMTQADSVHSTPGKTASKIVEFPKKPIKPAKRQSALVGLRDSGLDLVARKKTPREKRATQKDYAKIKFRALKRDERVMRALGEGWHQHGISARIAYASMIMSREKWIEFHAEMDHDHVDQMLAGLIDTAEFLKSVVQMIDCAQTRLVATGCAALERGVLGDGKYPVRFEDFQTTPRLVFSQKAVRSEGSVGADR